MSERAVEGDPDRGAVAVNVNRLFAPNDRIAEALDYRNTPAFDDLKEM